MTVDDQGDETENEYSEEDEDDGGEVGGAEPSARFSEVSTLDQVDGWDADAVFPKVLPIGRKFAESFRVCRDACCDEQVKPLGEGEVPPPPVAAFERPRERVKRVGGERVMTTREAKRAPVTERLGVNAETIGARPKPAVSSQKPEPAGVMKPQVPVTRVGQALSPEDIASGVPPPVFETERGGNCVIVVAINGVRFRLTCDSGASRDVIRTSFAEKLRKEK